VLLYKQHASRCKGLLQLLFAAAASGAAAARQTAAARMLPPSMPAQQHRQRQVLNWTSAVQRHSMQQGTAHQARTQARMISCTVGMQETAGTQMSGSRVATLILMMRRRRKGVRMRTGSMLQLP
jgi:hypothetical protein